jgi:hypothetical protein
MPILERMTGFEPVPQGLEGPWATVTPHSLWFGTVSCQRPRCVELSSKRTHVTYVSTASKTQISRGLARVLPTSFRPKQKRPSRGSP